MLLCSSYSTPPLAPLTDRNKPAVWAATPREAGWILGQLPHLEAFATSPSFTDLYVSASNLIVHPTDLVTANARHLLLLHLASFQEKTSFAQKGDWRPRKTWSLTSIYNYIHMFGSEMHVFTTFWVQKSMGSLWLLYHFGFGRSSTQFAASPN